MGRGQNCSLAPPIATPHSTDCKLPKGTPPLSRRHHPSPADVSNSVLRWQSYSGPFHRPTRTERRGARATDGRRPVTDHRAASGTLQSARPMENRLTGAAPPMTPVTRPTSRGPADLDQNATQSHAKPSKHVTEGILRMRRNRRRPIGSLQAPTRQRCPAIETSLSTIRADAFPMP